MNEPQLEQAIRDAYPPPVHDDEALARRREALLRYFAALCDTDNPDQRTLDVLTLRIESINRVLS